LKEAAPEQIQKCKQDVHLVMLLKGVFHVPALFLPQERCMMLSHYASFHVISSVLIIIIGLGQSPSSVCWPHTLTPLTPAKQITIASLCIVCSGAAFVGESS
jgi:hypothetical protein